MATDPFDIRGANVLCTRSSYSSRLRRSSFTDASLRSCHARKSSTVLRIRDAVSVISGVGRIEADSARNASASDLARSSSNLASRLTSAADCLCRKSPPCVGWSSISALETFVIPRNATLSSPPMPTGGDDSCAGVAVAWSCSIRARRSSPRACRCRPCAAARLGDTGLVGWRTAKGCRRRRSSSRSARSISMRSACDASRLASRKTQSLRSLSSTFSDSSHRV
mmetsp:Transcript_13027/g.52518  ORF Transcript_13027/g.52518 Transcript_13027/m.52518 type:complete len:224 (-) Transcript_13027:361-1032(-)